MKVSKNEVSWKDYIIDLNNSGTIEEKPTTIIKSEKQSNITSNPHKTHFKL